MINGINDNKRLAGLFIDLKKAFDMVNHDKLLKKMYNIGIRGISFDWFCSYLCNRQQKVKIGCTYSSLLSISVGVPQGSVLGPLLFLIYVNSIFSVKFEGQPVAFADDIAFSYNSVNHSLLIKYIKNDLILLSQWLNENSLLLSEKTKVMFFDLSSKFSRHDEKFYYHSALCDKNNCCSDCFEITSTNEVKYLGITLDYHLNWKSHIRNIVKYLCTVLSKIYILRKLCPFYILKNVYYSLVESKLSYGLVCWGGTYYHSILPIIKLQKQVVKAIQFKPRYFSSWSLFSKANILPLRYLYCFKVLRIFFLRCGNVINRRVENYNSRSNLQYLVNVPMSKKEIFRRYYISTAPFIFNKLPLKLRSIKNKYEFLKEIKIWLFTITDIENLLKIIK